MALSDRCDVPVVDDVLCREQRLVWELEGVRPRAEEVESDRCERKG